MSTVPIPLGNETFDPNEELRRAALNWRPGQPAIAPYQAQQGLTLPAVGGKLGPDTDTSAQAAPARGTLEGDKANLQKVAGEKPAVSKIAPAIEGSGFGQNHPFLGKALGNVAQFAGAIGDKLIPAGVASELPWTTVGHNVQLGQAQKAVSGEDAQQKTEAETGEQKALAGLHGAQETAAELTPATQQEADAYGIPLGTPLNAAIRGALAKQVGVNAGKTDVADVNAQAKRDTEKPENKTYDSLVKGGMDPLAADKAINEARALGKPTTMQKTAVTDDEGQQIMADFNPVSGKYYKPDGTEIKRPRNIPQAAQLGPVGVTPENKVVRFTPGTTVEPGTMTPSQTGNLYAPTGQEKTAAGRAQIVMKELPNVIKSIDDNADKLGPVMGRWNDFMQGKVGMENKEFSSLRANLMMMATAVAMAHAVGRLPENLRAEFDNAINAPKQSPENLKAIIQAIQPWMEDMSHMAQPGFNVGNPVGPKSGGANTPPSGAKIIKWGDIK